MNYTLNQLRIFHTVAEMGSITLAAEKLNLSQPAVSMQLKKLQTQFEIPLTEILGRKVFITDFGEKVAEDCAIIMANADRIEETVSSYKGLVTGKLKISIVSTAKYVLPFFLEGYMKKYSGVELDIDVTNKGKVVKSLEENLCDFAMVSVLPNSINLNATSLMQNELNLVCSSKMPTVTSPQELSDKLLIFRENGSATRAAMEAYLQLHKVKGYKKMVLVSNEAVKQAVIAGLGYSIMPHIGLMTELQIGSIKINSLSDLPLRTIWNLVYDKQKRLSPAAKALIAYLEEEKDSIVAESFAKFYS